MDAHQQPGALDALIQDGLSMQGMGQHLDQLVHESVQDVLGGQLPDAPLSSLPEVAAFELPPMDMNIAMKPEGIASGDVQLGQSNLPPGQDLDSQARETNNSAMGIAAQRPRRRAAAAAANFATDVEGSEDDSLDEEGEGEAQETGSSGRPGRAMKRRRNAAGGTAGDNATKTDKKPQHMQGRFSGRLPTKEDERKLADECQLMAPLLSEDGALCTLPTIIRAMATGSVRAHLEKQRSELNNASHMLQVIEAANGKDLLTLSQQLVDNQTEANMLRAQVAALEQQLADAGLSAGGGRLDQAHAAQPQALQRMGSLSAGAVAAALGTQGVPLPVQTVAVSVPMQATAQPVAQPVVIQAAPQVVQVAPATGMQPAQVVQVQPAEVPTAIVAQQVLPSGVSQPVVVTAVQPAAAPGLLRSIPSSAQLIDSNGQPTMAVVQQQAPVAAAQQTDGPAAQAAGVAASNLNEHAQQLAVTAKLHEAAKTEASVQAQQLAAQAQQHAQASVQAAAQAEELKKTLLVIPDSQQAQQAAATVQNLEARAQAHASITTQVVAQARGMHEKAKAHENEQFKAITQASVLQAHAQSLQVSAHQMEVSHQVVTQAVTTSADPQPMQTTAAQMNVAAAPPVPSLQSIPSGAPTASGEVMGQQQQQQQQQQDPGRLPTTPLSTASGGNLFTATGANAPAPAGATVAMVQPTLMQAGQAVQLVVPQAPQPQPALVAAPAPTLMHAAPSGDQSAEIAVLQQQVAVLQAQQQAAAAAVVQQAAIPQASAPVQVQVLQPQVSLPRVTSHGMLALMQNGSGAVTIDSNNVPVPAPEQAPPAPAAMEAQPPPQPLPQLAPAGESSVLDVPHGLDTLLPTSQPLVVDPFAPPATEADMAPVVSIPEAPPVSTGL